MTDFDAMSHEEMLAWLDVANSGHVQSGADQLIAAAKEIRKIGEEFKVRPQWVEWKGEGADSFRTWAGDLANATLRLADFSEDASSWMGRASSAIAQAQASIPRDVPSAKANLEAAHAARNDPDAAAVASKSSSELAALAASKEKMRQEAAAEMRKLGQSYDASADQLEALAQNPPRLPPPPDAFVPDGGLEKDKRSTDVAFPGSDQPATANKAVSGGMTHAAADEIASVPEGSATVAPGTGERQGAVRAPVQVDEPAHTAVDSVATVPAVASPQGSGPAGPPPTTPTPLGGPFGEQVAFPPVGGPGSPVRSFSPTPGQGRPVEGRRMPGGAGGASPQERGATMPGRGVPGLAPGPAQSGTSGISGGRPAPAVPGRPATGTSRGLVMGGEGTAGRGAAGNAMAPGVPSGRVTSGRQGTVGGGARDGGIIGGQAERPGRTPTRSATPGGSAVARGGIVGGRPQGTSRSGVTRNGAQSGATPRPAAPRSRGGTRPGYLVEDEETWRPDNRRIVPPVVD
uniref:Translation initiation factor IF-2 n=1 Tax=Streptomyces sp. NBC_00003 TaxID=2903608 RepID=A0AAU2V3N0_9ACTN